MRQYDQAKAKLEEGSEEAMIVFYNTRLALCWARTKETTRYDELMARAEPYKLRTVPAVRIIRNTVVNRTNVRVGEVVQCSEADARLLLAIGKAERIASGSEPAAALLRSPSRTDRANRTHHTRGTTS